MASSIYTAWSVVAGEQPTTAKWNILGTNDGSFNTGQGFNDGIIASRHFGTGVIPNSAMQAGAVAQGTTTTAGEVTYTTGSWINVGGMTVTVTTSVASQTVTVFSQMQVYSGGYSQFRYTLDGTAVTNNSKYQTGVNGTTTGMLLYMDFFTIPAAGSHTIQLQANGGAATLRIIHGEGTGRCVAFLS